MTDREFTIKWFVQNHPEEKELVQSFMDKGVKEILRLIRIFNASRNRGELNSQFIEWILEQEKIYHEQIRNVIKLDDQKVRFTYFSMIFTILTWEGCYIRGKGKKHAPNIISYSKFCGSLVLNLQDRLESGNVRKALAAGVYSINYLKNHLREKNGEKVLRQYGSKLEEICLKIAKEMRQKFL